MATDGRRFAQQIMLRTAAHPGGSAFSSRVRAAATRAWEQRVPVLFADVSLRPVDCNFANTQSVYFTDWGSRD